MKKKYLTTYKKRLFKQSKSNPNAIIVNKKEIILNPDINERIL